MFFSVFKSLVSLKDADLFLLRVIRLVIAPPASPPARNSPVPAAIKMLLFWVTSGNAVGVEGAVLGGVSGCGSGGASSTFSQLPHCEDVE